MVLGFAMAAYAIVANDSIQTLGTFLSSNAKRPWWLLWIFISGILIITVGFGWVQNGGDPAFGRLSVDGKNVPFPPQFTWLFILPTLLLVIFTQKGIPVSTSLLVLTAFKGLVSFQMGKDTKGAVDLFQGMMKKSLVGYAIAFGVGLIIYIAVLHVLEKKVLSKDEEKEAHVGWVVFQWCSTGFLWSMWLIQDLANIFCYLPRELSLTGLILSLAGMVLLQGYLIKKKGGKIQGIVTSKTNTLDVRSATFIDFLYGIVLLVFKLGILKQMGIPIETKMPMSTTWVFLGLLAGRELGITIRLKHLTKGQVSKAIFSDSGKAFLGSVVSVLLALLLPFLAKTFTPIENSAEEPLNSEVPIDSPEVK